MFETLDSVSGLIRTAHSMRELEIIFVAEELALYEITIISFLGSPRKSLCHSTHCFTGVSAPNFLVNKMCVELISLKQIVEKSILSL